MNEERIRTLFEDETFVRNLMEQDTPEQVQELLINYEIDLSVEEINQIRELLEKHENGEVNLEELSDDDLENVSGGVFGTVGMIVFCCVCFAGSVGMSAWIIDGTQRINRRRW